MDDRNCEATLPSLAQIVEYTAKLEALAGRYIYEAHNQSLDGLDICEHEAGICFCSYHGSLRRLIEALTNSPIKRPNAPIECTYDRQLDSIGNDLVWTQKIKILDGEVRDLRGHYERLKDLTEALLLSEEMLSLQTNGFTGWHDRHHFQGLVERIQVHMRF
jgi:hypothetical protein